MKTDTTLEKVRKQIFTDHCEFSDQIRQTVSSDDESFIRGVAHGLWLAGQTIEHEQLGALINESEG